MQTWISSPPATTNMNKRFFKAFSICNPEQQSQFFKDNLKHCLSRLCRGSLNPFMWNNTRNKGGCKSFDVNQPCMVLMKFVQLISGRYNCNPQAQLKLVTHERDNLKKDVKRISQVRIWHDDTGRWKGDRRAETEGGLFREFLFFDVFFLNFAWFFFLI